MIEISYEDKKNLIKDLEKIRESMLSEKLPRRADKKKCGYCEVARYCMSIWDVL